MSVKQAVNELRQEYFELKASMSHEHRHLDSDARCFLKELEYSLKDHERIGVESRIKDCDSAVDSLRRKQPGRDFVDGESYSLKQLKDLVGLRILAFPANVMEAANKIVINKFSDWQADHKQHGAMQVYKYYRVLGVEKIPCEIQVVSMLTGKFWDVEHSALYKPSPAFKGAIEANFQIRDLYKEVMDKLAEFEAAFEAVIRNS